MRVEGEAGTGPRSRPTTRAGRTPSLRDRLRALDPIVVAIAFTILFLPIAKPRPRTDLDDSWRLGLSLVHQRGIGAGSGFVFTYGPLGFLNAPNIVWLPGAVLGVAYAVVSAFFLYWLLARRLNEWLSPVWAAVLTGGFALVGVQALDTPETATLALVLWCFDLVRPERLAARLPPWVPVVIGSVAAVQLLVKFSVGLVALGAGAIVCIARPPRLARVLTLGGSFVGALLVLWLVVGDSLADLPDWLRQSLDIALGYSGAMGLSIESDRENPGRYWPWAVLLFALAAYGLWRFARRHGARSIPFVALFVVMSWAFLKMGFVRLDWGHSPITFLGMGALLATLSWRPRRIAVGVAGVVVALVATLAALATTPSPETGEQGGLGRVPSTFVDVVKGAPTGTLNTARVLRAVVQPSYQERQLEGARQEIRRKIPIPPEVIESLRGREVHASPADIAAVWAYDLAWRPATVFQEYSAYSNYLDDLNADSLRSDRGPDAVLHNQYGIDHRLPEWQSPHAMLELACSYVRTAGDRDWAAFRRSRNRCGAPQLLSEVTVPAAQPIEVPRASNGDSIVAASFDVPLGVRERLATALLKPLNTPYVLIDDTWHRFDMATDGQRHLVHVPNQVAGRGVPAGGLDIESLRFPEADGDVTVRFYEIPMS